MCDDGGIDIAELEKRIIESEEKHNHVFTERKPFWGIVYLISVNYNPTGVSYDGGTSFFA